MSINFERVISNYIYDFANENMEFRARTEDPKKSIKDCCTYIMNQVKKTGEGGYTDREIFGLARHYYDEDEIDVGKAVEMTVVVNHHVEFTEADKKNIKAKAIEAAIKQEKDIIIGNKMKADERAKKKNEAKMEELKKRDEENKKAQSSLF